MYSANSESFSEATRKAFVECCRTAGTTSSFRYLMNSGISFSMRSAASATALLTRADASSTLRLKSFMMLLETAGRECIHARVADARQGYYFLVQGAGQWRGGFVAGVCAGISLLRSLRVFSAFSAVQAFGLISAEVKSLNRRGRGELPQRA